MPNNMVLLGMVTGALPTLCGVQPLRAKLVPCLLLLTLVAVMDWRDQQAITYLVTTLVSHYIFLMDLPNRLFLAGTEAACHCCSSCYNRWVGGTWHLAPPGT